MVDHSPGSDFLALDPREAPTRARSAWLAEQIRTAIANGVMAQDARIPSSRTLAADLGFARGTVVAAYQELTDSGWLRGQVGAGTVVTHPRQPTRKDVGIPAPVKQAPPEQSTKERRVRLNLTPGRPDLAFMPRAQWLRAHHQAMQSLADADFTYPDPQGDSSLREEIAAMLRRTRGMAVAASHIIITAGVSQATALLFEVLRRGGATAVAVEDPGSHGLHNHVRHWGLATHPVPVDDGGLIADALGSEEAVLLTPAHQFPTGAVLSPQRRHHVIRWARTTGAVIIEDDYDAEHRYDRAPVSAMHALSPDCTAYAGSVSKTIAPGLRLGWLIPPPALLTRLVAHKDASDRGSPILQQRALAFLLRHGHVTSHLRRVRTRQRQRRDALLDGLRSRPHNGEIRGVAAGLHLLMSLPEDVDDVLVTQALAQRDVLVEPLSLHRISRGRPGLVIGYAATTVDGLREAGAIIAEVTAAL